MSAPIVNSSPSVNAIPSSGLLPSSVYLPLSARSRFNATVISSVLNELLPGDAETTGKFVFGSVVFSIRIIPWFPAAKLAIPLVTFVSFPV